MKNQAKSGNRFPAGSPPATEASNLADWIDRDARRDVLRLVVCGSAGDGKSTLISRLLSGGSQASDEQASTSHANAKRQSRRADPVKLALLTDGYAKEHVERGADNTLYRFFSTRHRKFIVADTPGDTKNTLQMISGASTADGAVVLIDPRQGLITQTRRHAFLMSLIGVRHVILAINKMDLISYDRGTFDRIVADASLMANSLGFESMVAIPVSALWGGNVTSRSTNTPWYHGPTLLGSLETMPLRRPTNDDMALPVQWINRTGDAFHGFSGTLASGRVAVGDQVRVTSSGQTATVARIVTADGNLPSALAGDPITLILDPDVDASRGDVITSAGRPMEMTDQFEAMLIWAHDECGLLGRAYDLKLASQWTTASITSLKYRVDVRTNAQEPCRQLALGDIAVVNLALGRPIAYAPYSESTTFGGFIMVDKATHATVAVGLIRHNLRRAQNVHRQALSVRREDRERLNGHKGKVVWLTGLSGSGKSTIANALEQELHAQGKRTYILDGDNIRQGINKDLGFTDADRVENIRRVTEVAKLMMDAGLIVITAFISPFRAERQMARELIGRENFVEVFVDTPLDVCERRDPKGLYKKARSGLLPNMTGVNSPYEPPHSPEVKIFTHTSPIEVAVKEIQRVLMSSV